MRVFFFSLSWRESYANRFRLNTTRRTDRTKRPKQGHGPRITVNDDDAGTYVSVRLERVTAILRVHAKNRNAPDSSLFVCSPSPQNEVTQDTSGGRASAQKRFFVHPFSLLLQLPPHPSLQPDTGGGRPLIFPILPKLANRKAQPVLLLFCAIIRSRRVRVRSPLGTGEKENAIKIRLSTLS